MGFAKNLTSSKIQHSVSDLIIDYTLRKTMNKLGPKIIDGKEPGWIIPLMLKKNWELKIGKSKDVLPLLADSIGQLDFFLHDSEHTYENMMFELKLVWKKLRSGGILICDNIDANKSFEDFCISKNKKPLLLPVPSNSFNEQIRFGLLVK